MMRALTLAALLALAGCAQPGDFCDLASPLRLTDATIDAATDDEIADFVAHNRRGERFCGWKP
jgi:hypothetical protein